MAWKSNGKRGLLKVNTIKVVQSRLRVSWGITVCTRAYNMKSARNISIEDNVEMLPKKLIAYWWIVRNDWEMLIGGWHSIPQQHYFVEIRMSGGGQVTKITLQLHGSRGSAGRFWQKKQLSKCKEGDGDENVLQMRWREQWLGSDEFDICSNHNRFAHTVTPRSLCLVTDVSGWLLTWSRADEEGEADEIKCTPTHL